MSSDPALPTGTDLRAPANSGYSESGSVLAIPYPLAATTVLLRGCPGMLWGCLGDAPVVLRERSGDDAVVLRGCSGDAPGMRLLPAAGAELGQSQRWALAFLHGVL